MEYRAALFASRGYASLSLAYIGHKELPAPHNRMNVGDSYFKVKYPALCWCHITCFSTFVYLFLDREHSSYFRIILRSVLTKSGSSVSPLGSIWLFEQPLSPASMFVTSQPFLKVFF